MAFIPPIGSIVAFQSDPTKLVGTVSVVGMDFGNSSVVSILKNSSVTVLQGTNPWFVNMPSPSVIAYQAAGSVMAVSGSFSSGNTSVTAFQGGTWISSLVNTIPSSVQVGASIMGTVPVTQTTTPWVINMPSPSVISYQAAGSVMAVSGSFSGGNSSVQLLNSTAIIGSVTALQGTSPWLINVPSPSVISYQAAGSIMAVTGSFTANPQSSIIAIQLAGSVLAVNMPSPSVIAYQLAGSIMAVSATVNTGNSSVQLLGGVAVIGSVAVLQGTSPWIVGNSSVQTIQGTTPWVVGSVIATIQSSVAAAITNITASVIVNQGTNPWVIGSIVGTYAEDIASNNNDKGLFTLGIRNDTVSSLVNADMDYTGWATDSAGRHLIKPFASEDGAIISYRGSVISTSVTLIQASTIGKRNYITDFWVANTGSVATLITFIGGDTSIIAYTIAPAGGGSNSPGIAIPLKTTQGQDLAFQISTASSVVYMTVKGYQAQ